MASDPASSQPAQTLLSIIRGAESFDACSAESLHPFSSTAPSTLAALDGLVQSTDELSGALLAYTFHSFSDPKLISLLRQHTAMYGAVHSLEQNTSALITALQARKDIHYGEDLPSSSDKLEEFCVSRVQDWATAVGMQMIKDMNGVRKMVTLAGNILVIDIELAMGLKRLEVTSLKVSYAIPNPPNGMLTTEGSLTLNACLRQCIDAYLADVQSSKDPIEVQRKGRAVRDHLAYLKMLDKLALEEGDAGVRWFKESDRIAGIAEEVAKGEVEGVTASLNLSCCPLDIYLLRSHALPLPCVISPCLSFLIYLTPKAYLKLLRSMPDDSQCFAGNIDVDIPLSHLSTYLTNVPAEGASLAALRLAPCPPDVSSTASVPPQSQSPRPTFPLLPLSAPSSEHPFPRHDKYDWILDFTQSGQKGVVMAQSRMRAIEAIISGPMSDIDMGTISMNGLGGLVFGNESWVDLLLGVKDTSPVGQRRYISRYRSPSGAHPPLRLRLTTPPEPGFYLEQVHVRSMREVWGILEVVREQCWLNGMLESIAWSHEGAATYEVQADQDDGGTTEAELEAILNGTFTPLELPVNVYISSSYVSSSTPIIFMTMAERPPSDGMIEITAQWDEGKVCGVSVDVRSRGWGLGVDAQTEKLEEVCRRGGVWGLPGKIWSQAW